MGQKAPLEARIGDLGHHLDLSRLNGPPAWRGEPAQFVAKGVSEHRTGITPYASLQFLTISLTSRNFSNETPGGQLSALARMKRRGLTRGNKTSVK